MVWVLLAALGVPIGVALGALGLGLVCRRSVTRHADVFRAKLRVLSGECATLATPWPRRPYRCRWVHDVLLVHRGWTLARYRALTVISATGSLRSGDPARVDHLGSHPLLLDLNLDSGTTVQLAAADDVRDVMIGPFPTVLFTRREASQSG